MLTVADQQAIYAVARDFGASLAKAIVTQRAAFDSVLTAYPDPELRAQLRFDMIAGMLLNWEGLKVATRNGYRSEPARFANGDSYIVHSSERGARLPLEGLYWGSEGWPAGRVTFTTFGDPLSFPRSHGLPNAFDPIFDEGLAVLRDSPERFAATRRQLQTYLGMSIADLGELMLALRERPRTRDELARAVALPADRFAAALQLLESLDYVCHDGDVMKPHVPVLLASDSAIVSGVMSVGRPLLTRWLAENVPRMTERLSTLTPLQNGLAFKQVFNEVWHYVFGFTTKTLAEEEFYANPRAGTWPYKGYARFVWATTLYDY